MMDLNSPRPRPLRRQGYILVEAMIASAVLGAVLSVGLDNLARAKAQSNLLAKRSDVIRYAQREMERMRNKTYAALPASQTTTLGPGITSTITTTTVTENAPSVLHAAGYTVTYKVVRVRVSYTLGTVSSSVELPMVRTP